MRLLVLSGVSPGGTIQEAETECALSRGPAPCSPLLIDSQCGLIGLIAVAHRAGNRHAMTATPASTTATPTEGPRIGRF